MRIGLPPFNHYDDGGNGPPDAKALVTVAIIRYAVTVAFGVAFVLHERLHNGTETCQQEA